MDCLGTFEAYCSRAVPSFAVRSLASLAAGVSEERGAPLFSSGCLDGLQIVEGCRSRRLPLFSRWPRWPLAFCPRGCHYFRAFRIDCWQMFEAYRPRKVPMISLCTRWPRWPLALRSRAVPFFRALRLCKLSKRIARDECKFPALRSLASLATGVSPENVSHGLFA